MDYSSLGCKESDITEVTEHAHACMGACVRERETETEKWKQRYRKTELDSRYCKRYKICLERDLTFIATPPYPNLHIEFGKYSGISSLVQDKLI